MTLHFKETLTSEWLLCCLNMIGTLNIFGYVLQIKTVLDVAENVKRIVLLSGTPSISRLWKSKS